MVFAYLYSIFLPLLMIGLFYYLPRRRSPIHYLFYPSKFRNGKYFRWSDLSHYFLALFIIIYLYFTLYWLFAMFWMEPVQRVVLTVVCLLLMGLVRRKWPKTVFLPLYLIAWLIPLFLSGWTLYFQFISKESSTIDPPGVTPLLRLEHNSWQSLLESRLDSSQIDLSGSAQQPRAITPSGLPDRFYFSTGAETDGFFHLLMRYNLVTRELELAQIIPGCAFRGACDPSTKRCYFAITQDNHRPGERISAITVFDEVTEKFLPPIPTEGYPRQIAIDPERRCAYASLCRGKTFLTILDLDQQKVRYPRLRSENYSGRGPCVVWTNPLSGRTYGNTDQFLSPIYLYDPVQDRLSEYHPPLLWHALFGYGISLGLAASPDDRYLFVAYPFSGYVAKYELTPSRLVEKRFLEPGAREMVVPADTRCLFVGGFNLGNLYVLDKQTLTVLKRTHIGLRLRQFLYLPQQKAVLLGDSRGYSLVDVSDVCY